MKRRLALVSLMLLAVPACRDDDNAVLLIVVTASGSPPTVSALEVTITNTRAGSSSNRYTLDGQPIAFPTTLSAQLPVYATGDVTIDIDAEDAAGKTVASGHGETTVRPSHRQTAYVRLDCSGEVCVIDGGAVDPDGGMMTTNPRCGNGRVDPGETCDTAIVAGAPGACPPTCDDAIACTRDTRSGSDCTVVCAHPPIETIVLGDGCCPSGVKRDDGDPDCSPTCGNGTVDPGETCDTGIRGAAGACPTTGDCMRAGCTEAQLVSAGTCSAVCARYPIVTQSGKDFDSCCPPGATNAVDSDCEPACGNGLIDPSETCDVGIPPLLPGACPTSCDDGKSCTIDFFLTTGCQPACNHFEITTPVSGDGCCPKDEMQMPRFTQAQDTDCPARCGNNVVERGEACDPKTSCPKSCPLPPSKKTGRVGCLRAAVVNEDDCTAHCEVTELTACDRDEPDDCCPAGCTAQSDIDCPSVCGDGLVSTTLGEECDIAGNPNECPLSCSDGDPCTEDLLVSAGTCAARCVFLPITSLRAGDGCCPPGVGANFTLDPDCRPSCGNRVVEPPAERCDYMVNAVGCPGPTCSCPGPEACPTSAFCTRFVVEGSAESCSSACVAMPITQCVAGDGCCPPGCTTANDTDCLPICGNGVVEGVENCDRGITAGHQGACPSTCDDGNACTLDFAAGSTEGCTRSCSHHPVTGCIAGDGCCPAGCSAARDPDCETTCGDMRIGAGETCDPPSTCPTACADDGDPCTAEQLTGSAAGCNTACRHVPITACSPSAGDTCCPTGCTKDNDWDCQ